MRQLAEHSCGQQDTGSGHEVAEEKRRENAALLPLGSFGEM
jgi:hypothetical protein